jgi:hypothetical protein
MIHEPPNHEPDIDPQGLWQSQKKEYDPMTLADIHMKAQKFDRRIQGRNAREYIACGVVMVGFAPAIFIHDHWLMKVGAVLIILATAFIAWQLHRRASTDGSVAPGETLVDAYRRQLIRQRDAVRSPLMPGMTLFIAGMWFQSPKPGVQVEKAHANLLILAVVWVVLCAGIWWLNQWAAKRLQKKIDEL